MSAGPEIERIGGSGGGTGTQTEFAIYGPTSFTPHYIPRRFSFSKNREINRTENFCGGEDIEDLGSKNREIHISGLIRRSEVGAFNNLMDGSEPLDLISPGWSGEVRVVDGEYEGPKSTDPMNGENLYQFTLNLVSTGKDEANGHSE